MRFMNEATLPKPRSSTSHPLPLPLRRELADLIARFGENRTRRTVGVSRAAFARALAGLGIYPGTASLIRVALDAHRASSRGTR